MTKVDLQQVLDLDAHATVGPWEHVETNYRPHLHYVLAEGIGGIALGTKPADAGLIAVYRTAAPTMAEALKAVPRTPRAYGARSTPLRPTRAPRLVCRMIRARVGNPDTLPLPDRASNHRYTGG